ncbi:LacI family transcriptional regulator [Actinomyces viscosus]|uniref:Catabolite control protein n=1 Tax=Actinomyces viscosus TaxID=1656 RepID=A0A3S4VDT9_ACTVI|nr:LacI family DNA-binding transcriptional regulator [Actinomyces viscosus]TFH53191.1 LacI family transcriptional regulator [Actinomyces viscosus]VEI15580.1 Catabolite control protein [Actinomyces viscosus]
MAATRADVARAAGVSPSTVTYVLSGQRSTRSSTRERVMRAVRELGYHPNTAARSLASPVLRTVGVLFRRQRATIDANDLDYVDGVRRALEPSGIQVVIPVMKSPASLIELRSLVRSGSLGGVVLMDVAQGDEREEMLLKEKVPTVLIGSSGRSDGAPGIDTDFAQMAGAAIAHLAGLGHRRIVALLRETAHDDSHARQDQGHELLRAAGDLGVDLLVRQVPELALAGGDVVGADGLADGCTAVVSNNPAALVGLACAAKVHGLSIPADLSVLTLGVTEYGGRQGQAFSEMSVDREAMGAAAGSTLLARLRGHPAPAEHRALMSAVLRDRGSTEPCLL